MHHRLIIGRHSVRQQQPHHRDGLDQWRFLQLHGHRQQQCGYQRGVVVGERHACGFIVVNECHTDNAR